MSWMSINAQVVPWCTNTFLWMPKMTLDAAGCSRWPSLQLDVSDVYWHTSFALMHQGIYMDAQDDPWCSWMSWMSIDVQVVPCCTNTFLWMLKMTLDAAGCSWWPLMRMPFITFRGIEMVEKKGFYSILVVGGDKFWILKFVFLVFFVAKGSPQKKNCKF